LRSIPRSNEEKGSWDPGVGEPLEVQHWVKYRCFSKGDFQKGVRMVKNWGVGKGKRFRKAKRGRTSRNIYIKREWLYCHKKRREGKEGGGGIDHQGLGGWEDFSQNNLLGKAEREGGKSAKRGIRKIVTGSVCVGIQNGGRKRKGGTGQRTQKRG